MIKRGHEKQKTKMASIANPNPNPTRYSQCHGANLCQAQTPPTDYIPSSLWRIQPFESFRMNLITCTLGIRTSATHTDSPLVLSYAFRQ
jgi:hypothetical protein